VRAGPRLGWAAFGALLALGALAGWLAPREMLDWQPQKAWTEPWRWWSAAFVHWSGLHLGANLLGCAVVGWFGWAAQAPSRLVWAWFAAWPLTHLALLAQPALAHYGGLSGVLHAGVAACALALAWRGQGRQRWVGAAVLAGLLLKVLLEAPWQGPLRRAPGWDIALAPLAHAAGVACGLLCAAFACRSNRTRRR
jgi:rhomboid family GlyGly-CTERM serine protease